ncbi:MAG: LacI family DNA-binding transcriptional regulator [Propionicimonas sp.]|uniref:LacI family DNA-binding transcriptional regulator n=1 Tax=Propionicimonas sp. TaxID=1955623 RepID=UPI003D0EB5AC
MITIYDVAAKAGVSPATVSRVFNGIKVTPERAEAVRAAATELGFVPNRNARRLRTSSSEIIAMMVPDIENPFFTVMTRAVEDVARAGGYSVMLCNTDEDPEREQDYLRAAVSDPVAGIVIVPSSRTTNLDLPLERGVPVVCVDRRAPGYQVDAVVAENVAGATASARQLFASGYHRVACISGPEGVETADDRARGWAAAVREVTGADPEPALVVRTTYTVTGGEEATRQLLALPDPPDAVFAANNRLASGAIRVLAEAGLLPPAVGVASFGGLPLVLLIPAGIQVAHLPARELGLTAATMLLERIRGLDAPAREVVLPVAFSDEESTISVLEGRTAVASTEA